MAFLQNPHPAIADRRRLWPASGLDSTMQLLKEIGALVKKNDCGREAWHAFVQDEVSSLFA